MFRRLRLPGKLVLAVVPLVVALATVSTLFVRSTFTQAAEETRAADLASVLVDVRAAVDAVAAETEAAVGLGSDDVPVTQETTDAAFDRLDQALAGAAAPPLQRQFDSADRRLEQVRTVFGSEGATDRVVTAYDQVAGDLLAVASLIPAEVSNEDAARSLHGLAAIGQGRHVARIQGRVILQDLVSSSATDTTVDRVRDLQLTFVGHVDTFHTVASGEARTIFAQSGAPVAIGGVSTQIDRMADPTSTSPAITTSDWQRLLEARAVALETFETSLTEVISQDAVAASAAATRWAWIVGGASGLALLLAAVLTLAISRSIVRRVRSVTERAQHVAQEQLPALVEALRDPDQDSALPSLPPIRDRGADEVGDLARSFAAMQSTLEHVAEQQVEILRKGVAEMFVTLARRNRSLVDRQLALIDELESDEEDPAALAELYRLDHMATRMRRNAESLLVLAGTEPARSWRTPMSIDDVVRAAIGEIEDYRRVDVLTLEGVTLKGSVISDLSHLLSELLENATHFSPPQTRVRVSGHFHEQGFLITISDRGVGVPQARMLELNHLLDKPPVIGLALEPTLGLYVVAMLGKRHGIQVRLVPGAPGVSAKLLVPPSLYDARASEPPIEAVGTGRLSTARAALAEARASRPPQTLPVGEGERRRQTERPDGQTTRSAPAAPPAHHVPESAPSLLPTRPPLTVVPAASAGGESDLHLRMEVPPRAKASQPTTPPLASAEPHEPSHRTGLPVRRPGTSYAPDPSGERSVTATQRTPEAVRSSFGAFQTGLEAGRREASEGEDT